MKRNTGPLRKFALPSIWRNYHSPPGLPDHVGLGELLRTVGEMAAEDHGVGPNIANHVGPELARAVDL